MRAAVVLFILAALAAGRLAAHPTPETARERAIAQSADREAIFKLLAEQEHAWNRGDIRGFMAAYEKSDTLRFASGGTITRGWQPTLDRYLQRYPDQAAMGTLRFKVHEVDLLAPDAAVVFGRWELTRAADKPWGLFTLVMKKDADGWRIASDHTSSAE